MKEKILALLITKFSGVRKDGLTQLAGSLALQVLTEEEAQALVDKLDQSKVTEFVKEYRSGVDKEVSTATKTSEDKLKEKFDLVEKGGVPIIKTEDIAGDDIDSKLKAYVDTMVKPLTEKIQGYEAKEKTDQRQSFITSKAKELGIPEWRIKEGFAIGDEADEATISNTLSSIKQNIVTAGLEKSPGFPIDLNTKPTTEETDAVLDKIGI